MTEITRIRLTDKANNYGGASGTTTESDFRVPIDCAPTADPAVGSSCAASTSADALQPGFITEERQTVIQAFRVRVDDASRSRGLARTEVGSHEMLVEGIAGASPLAERLPR